MRGGGGGRCVTWLELNGGSRPGITVAPGGSTDTRLGRTLLGMGGGGTAWIIAGGGRLVGGAGMELAAMEIGMAWLGSEPLGWASTSELIPSTTCSSFTSATVTSSTTIKVA